MSARRSVELHTKRLPRHLRAERSLAEVPTATLHEVGGDARLDATLALVDLAVNGGADALDRVCVHVARACAVDVCSIYVLERGEGDAETPTESEGQSDHIGDRLVLRATRGLPKQAIGRVSMAVGEGLTGGAAAYARPVSVAALDHDARNFAVADLGEERFPALCAVPMLESGRVVAVLVVQRKERRAWLPDEVARLASLSAAALIVLLRVRELERRAQHESSALGAGSLLAQGVGSGKGAGVGSAYLLAAPTNTFAPSGGRALGELLGFDSAAEIARLQSAFREARADVRAICVPTLRRLTASSWRRTVTAYAALLDDRRLEEAAEEEIERGLPAEIALERVARTYARVLGSAPDPMLRARADDFDEAIGRVLDRLSGIGPALKPPLGSVLVATRLGIGGALMAYTRHPAAVILTDQVATAPAAEILAALGIPVVTGVALLMAHLRGGDLVIVDADSGQLCIRPSRAQVAEVRRRRRDGEPAGA